MGDRSGLPGPTDSWVTLGGLALQTSRIRLGTMVTAATFRLPGPLAISVAQVDQMSGGRIEFGFGTGWFEQEHTAYGIPFPSLKERFDRFEEQLAIITGLWATPPGQTFSHRGAYYQLTDSPALPKLAQQPRPPVILGGAGPAHAAAGGPVRGRVQPGVQEPGRHGGGVQQGPGGLRGSWAGPVLDRALGRPDGVLRQGRGGGGPPRRGHRAATAGPSRERPDRHAGRGRRRHRPLGRRRGRPSTCRSSTSTTWTTWSCSLPRCCPRCEPAVGVS